MKTTEDNAGQLSETKRLDQFISRRRAMIMALGGTALAGLAFTGSAQAQTAVSDNDILNFALNLEYLEAQYYTLATSGRTIDDPAFGVGISGTGTRGAVTFKANPLVPFSTTDKTIFAYAMETAAEERKHVTLLRNALGSVAVAQPALDLLNSFNGLAQAAGIGSTFDPFASELNFLLGSYIFEDVGVTAYHGAAALLTVQANLVAASGLLGAEAYHAGLIRTVLFGMGALQAPDTTIYDTTAKISAARALLDGTGNDDIPVGVGTAVDIGGSAATIVNADSKNAIAFARTTDQVLHIVYAKGAGKVSSGGFFPVGLNGTITSTAA